MSATDDVIEDLESFRRRARHFITSTLGPAKPSTGSLRLVRDDEEELAEVTRDRALQRQLADAGLAGICIPREYGGQGLTPAHQQVLNEELAGYEYPARLQAPNFSPCAAVLLDCASEELKRRHLPAIIAGDEIWMQFLSEPSSGSDAAGAQLTATRDGDDWILNGSKIWTTGAWWSDWGLVLARTNWDVPKHRGLTVFVVPITAPGIEVHRIEMLSGNREFCQEFFSDVRVPDTDRIGEVDDGWTVGTRWLFHERMLYNSPYVTLPVGMKRGGETPATMLRAAEAGGRLDDTAGRELLGEALMLNLAGEAMKRRIGRGISTGAMPDQSAALIRLFSGVATARTYSILFELAGAAGGVWSSDDGALGARGIDFLMRQAPCIGGGTTEMARNVISERLLGMPREPALDRDVAFRDVPRGSTRA
jgi:alkylation response protein AidB-like acyl-CoA dehydrogenase